MTGGRSDLRRKFAPEGSTKRWPWWLPSRFEAGVAVVLLFLLGFGAARTAEPTRAAGWAVDAVASTFIMAVLSLVATGLLMAIVVAASVAVGHVVRRRPQHREFHLAAVVGLAGVALAINVIPIVVYLYLFEGLVFRLSSPGISVFTAFVGGLLFSNMLLYYLFSSIFFELWRESGTLYVLSATFRNFTPDDHLREKWAWLVISRLKPTFFYVFSFTLFVDAVYQVAVRESFVADFGLDQGVLYVLFETVSNAGWVPKAIVTLASMLLLLWAIRLPLDRLRIGWERRHGLGRAATR